MKKFTLLLCFIIGLAASSYSQSDEVSFIHGLGDNTSVWNPMANQLATQFDFLRDDVSYNSGLAVNTSASSVFIPSGTVAVAHSLGGLLAREYLRQGSTSQMKALITVGTPHRGAPAAVNVQNGRIALVIGGWIEDLAAGPAVSLGSLAGRSFAERILENLGYVQDASAGLVNYKLQNLFGNIPSVDDLKTGSQFLNTLNASPNNTLPSARYAIFGSEAPDEGLEYVRIAESFSRDRQNPIENGTYVLAHRGISFFYFSVTSYYAYLSARYFYLHATSDSSDPLYFTYYDRAVFFATVANQWLRGFISLWYLQQRDWDKYVVGVNYYEGPLCHPSEFCKDANDGLLPAFTQAPSFFDKFDGVARRLVAEQANHIEETAHPSVRERLEEVFLNADVNIPEISSGGDGGDGDPDPFPEPCTDEEGNIVFQC